MIFLLAGVSGCLSRQSLGEPIDDAPQRAALLSTHHRPDVPQAVFRTLVRWGGREVSLVEVVRVFPDGSFSVAGMTDIGNTLYAVQIAPDGTGHVVSKSLPFSDRWLLEGLVAELLIPWNGPDETCRLYRLPDGAWAMARADGRVTLVFIFDAAGNWREFRRLSGGRLVSQVFLEWDSGPVPGLMRVNNRDRHYQAVRETVSGNP